MSSCLYIAHPHCIGEVHPSCKELAGKNLYMTGAMGMPRNTDSDMFVGDDGEILLCIFIDCAFVGGFSITRNIGCSRYLVSSVITPQVSDLTLEMFADEVNKRFTHVTMDYLMFPEVLLKFSHMYPFKVEGRVYKLLDGDANAVILGPSHDIVTTRAAAKGSFEV